MKIVLSLLLLPSFVIAESLCTGFGPQTPRDISSKSGSNEVMFSIAPDYQKMNLCNIHSHTNAEHKGPGFSMFAGSGENGGYKCNATVDLSDEEKAPYAGNKMKAVKPGDTIEMHWVHTSCDVAPGKGLGSCLSDACANPNLRVETQVFLVVNDEDALDFADFDYSGKVKNGYHQADSIPSGTGTPVVFTGSTTGPSYTQQTCSPLQVTWSVRPQCAKLSIQSLSKWAEDNVFEENSSHGVRQLVTAEELLSEIN